MSPQSSLCISKNVENCFGSCDEGVEHAARRVSHSTSQLVRDVGEAFHGQMSQHHGLAPSDDLASKSNPLRRVTYGIQLKKRKCNLSDKVLDQSTFNSDFLSGIFQDLAEADSQNPTPMSSDISEAHLIDSDSIASSRPNKRARFSSSSLSSTKSFSNLSAQTSSDSTVSSSLSRLLATQASAEISNPVTTENTAERIVDTVLNDSLCNIGFPCLPTAVSESSCSSNNLTQTAVHAAQVLETLLSSNVEGELEDEYGWFAEMDEDSLHQRFDAVDDAAKNCRAMACKAPADLTFAPNLTPKKPEVELDSEVVWAKAADTVDDVLGAVFF